VCQVCRHCQATSHAILLSDVGRWPTLLVVKMMLSADSDGSCGTAHIDRMYSTEMLTSLHVQPVTGMKRSRGRQPQMPLADQRLEILKLSSGGTRAVVKQEEMCVICEEGDGSLLHCNGPCLRVFHSKCIGLCVAPATATFTCDECLTGMVVLSSLVIV